ncbi:MAG: Co2+/Mg2+ efflux protein ApaG [Polynucleobacter sp.]|nr:Co2+/Mg2+ efflux protein ApaG [Polynucleobacter sp.]MDO8715004.1 Co2+/Mg2+ efflux protein ApaG [Polynucleobacter sp.]
MEQNSSMNPHEISIKVKTQYLPDQSDPDNRQFAFAYTVTIRNTGAASVQLIARHWFITDGDNDVQEVRGLGVVGQQPLLRAGEQFEYTSWATLPTPVGTMRGEYFCVTEEAQLFQAPIPEFALVMPRTLH